MYWERGWGPEFEKHLRRTDPFVTEVTWKFLPGLGRWQRVMAPHAGECCRFNALWSLLGGAVLGVLLHGHFQRHRARLKKFLLLFPLRILLIPAVHPSPTADSSLVRNSLWHLCTQHYGNSANEEHRVFLPCLFGEKHLEEIFMFLGPRQEPYMMLEAMAAPKDGEIRRAWCTAHPIQPAPLCWAKFRHSNPQGLHRTVVWGLFYPALLWGGPSSEGMMCDLSSRQRPASSGPVFPARGVGCSAQSNTPCREGA